MTEDARAPATPTEPAAGQTTPTTRELLAAEDWSPRAWVALLRDLYCTFDRRTLGFARILLGFLLCLDVIHRGAAWDDMYSDIGVLPTWLDLERPSMGGTFSIFHAFSTPGELRVLAALMFVNAFCLMVGYRTRTAQVLALLFQTGMNTRVSMIENGGYVVNNLLVLWTVFLPLGDRFSVDALLASMKHRRETSAAELNDRDALIPAAIRRPFVSVVGAAITIQIAAIYYFNVIHKTGSQWRDGTAVHYVLYTDRMVTPMVAQLRDHIPNFVILFMTRATISLEALIPVALLQPLARTWARRVVMVSMWTLHLAFGSSMTLGPFAWSLCVFATLLFSTDDWEIATRTMRRAGRARVVAFDPRSGAAVFACRLLARLDRFELLTFASEEGLPSGLAVRDAGRPDAVLGRAEALADVVAALPLGPVVAWVLRLPVVRDVLETALAAIERRDVSAFFGLRVPEGGAPAAAPDAPGEDVLARVGGWMVLLSVLAVGGAIAAAIRIDRPFAGLLLIVAVTSVTMAVDAVVALRSATLAQVRRAVVSGLRELLVLAMLAGAVNQAMVELWCINRRIKVPQPEPLATLAHKLRFLQGWFMFSPPPVMDDGTIVVDAITVDGRHIDPFEGGKPPDFDLLSAKSLYLSQIWGDYFNRMRDNGYSAYRTAMQEYIYRYPERTGRPDDAIVSGDVFWVHDMNPRWNDTRSWNLAQDKLFSFSNPHLSQTGGRWRPAYAEGETSHARIRLWTGRHAMTRTTPAPRARHASPLVSVLAACGPQEAGPASPATSGSAAAPKVEQQQVKNLGYFDVATLTAAPPAVAGRASTGGCILGALLSARPCGGWSAWVVDPRNRGPRGEEDPRGARRRPRRHRRRHQGDGDEPDAGGHRLHRGGAAHLDAGDARPHRQERRSRWGRPNPELRRRPSRATWSWSTWWGRARRSRWA